MEPVNAPPPAPFPAVTALPLPIPFLVLPIDVNGIVTHDVPCRGCSYNVRGQHESGKCPECGTPVGISIRGNLLRYSDPAWVEKLLRGVDLILWGLLTTLLGSGVAVVLQFTMGSRAHSFTQLVMILASGVGVIGAWLLTTPDPGTAEESQMVTAREVARFALIFGIGEGILGMWSEHQDLAPFIRGLLGVALALAAIVMVVGEVARLYYLKKLAMRIPDPALVKRANMLCWGYGISLAITGVFSGVMVLVSLILKQPSRGPWSSVIMVSSCITSLAALTLVGFMIVYVVMLFQFRKALKLQTDYARQTWAAATAPASLAPPAI